MANGSSNNVTVIDGTSDTVRTTIGTDTNPYAIAVDPVTSRIYVANYSGQDVTVIDGVSGTAIASVAVGNNPDGVVANSASNTIYVTNYTDGTVSVIDGPSNTVVSTVDVGTGPRALDVNPATDKVYVANYGDGTVSVINGATNTVDSTVTVGTNPSSVLADATTNKVYVANSGGGVTVIDSASNNSTTIIDSGEDFVAVTLNSASHKIYAVDNGGGVVVAIDGYTNGAMPVTVGTSPQVAVVDPVTGYVYVANFGSANATVIAPNAVQNIPLTASVQGMSDVQTVNGNSVFSTGNASPSFAATVSNSFSPNAPPPTALYYQLDAAIATWTPATVTTGVGTSSVAFQFALSNVPVGLHTVYVYAAYGNEGTSTSVGAGSGNSPEIGAVTAYLFAILPVSTTTTLSVDVNPQNSGDTVNFTAQVGLNVGANVPSGTVNFYDGSTLLGQSTLDGTGHATYGTSALTAGNHNITASYLGSSSCAGSSSGVVQEIIAGTPASIAAVSGGGQSTPFNSAFATPLVVLVLDGNLNPVPNVVVSFAGTGLSFANGGQSTTDGSGHASENVSAIAVGSLTATASVSGITTSASFSLAGVGPPVLAMSFSPSQIALNGTSALTFVISNPSANTVSLTGIGFTDNLPIGLAVASPNGASGSCNGTTNAAPASQMILLSGASLAANSNCTLTVNVAGQVSSGYTDLSGAVTSANGGTGNFASADLLVASGVTSSAASLNFGTQIVGTTSGSQSLTLTNNTANSVTVDNVVATGDFSETNTCGSVASAQTCSISVSFTPSTTGALSGSLIISDSTGVQVVLLSGTGVAPGVSLSPSSWNFGSIVVAQLSAPEIITVTNTGTSNLSVSALAAGGDFSETDNCASASPIAPGNTCAIQVTFQPTAMGSRSGALTVTDNAGTQVVPLAGTGVAAGVGLSASTLTFGSQIVGTTSTAQTVTLTNSGTSSLTVNSFAAGGDFAVTSPDCAPPLTLAQGLSCTLQVVFEPQAIGVRNGTVTISDSVGTHVVALTGTGVAPGVGLSSSALSFGNQLVSTTSVAQSVTVTNTGTSDLTVSSVTASGDFAASGDCVTSGALAPSATCTVSVTFSPVASGTRTGTVTLSDTAGTHFIALSGTGVTPGIGFSPSSVSFGSQIDGTTSAATNIIVTNTGTSNLTIQAITAAGDYSESDTCVGRGALIPNATCTISVMFSPVATGTRNGSITVADSLGSQVIALAGTGSAPGASVSPATLTFGSQTVNTTSSSQTATLTNNGSSNLTISSVTASGDFAESDTCTSSSPVAASGTCTITITFTPTAVGSRTGTVVIADGAGTQIVSLSGTGAAPGASLSPATLSFGSVTVGSSSQSTANINLSSGTASSLTVTSVSISGDYTFTNQCMSAVAPGSSCGLSVTFNPAVTGTRTGTVLIGYTVGTGSSQLVLALMGTGTAPGVGLSPSLINFGSETVGVTSSSQAVTLSNTGTSNLAISSISASGDFSQSNNCPATVTSPGQCTIQVTFTPAIAGARAGAVTISDGAGTQVVALSGTGVAAGVSLSSSTVNFGNQVVSTTSTAQNVTFTNSGAGVVTVSSVTAAGDFAQTNTCSTVASGNNCTISITFTPAAVGARTGTVTIVDSAGTHVIATSGTGTQPGGNLSTASLTYGSQTVGTTSAAQTVTLTNNGTSALTVNSFSTSGDFAATSSNCGSLPATVTAGNSCHFQVTFIPSTTGTRTGSLILSDTVGTQVVSLSGTGSAPGVSLAPSTLNFGTVTVGTSSQQTANVMLDIATASSLQVTGVSVTGDYTVVNNCTSTVAPGNSCSVSVTFNPAAIGTRTGTVLMNYTVATTTGQLVLALTGTGTAPGVSLTPSSLSFGSQVVGTSSSAQSTTLTNTGTSGLTGITITPIGDFSQTNNCGNTAAGANCSINVTFTPTAAGTRTGYMVITDNAGTQVLALSGTGTAPGIGVSPNNINFGGQVVGTTSSASTVTLTNNGTSTLSVSSVTASGDFAISANGCGSVNSGAHCTFQVTFTPTATGTRTGTVTIIDSVGTQVVSLSGTGNAPGVTLSTGLVDFGNYTVGTVSAIKTVTLTNTGTSSLTVNSFTVSGDYMVSSSNCANLPTTLAVNGFCTLQIVFAPTATGTRPGNVSIADNVGTHVVALTGVGLAPGVSLSPVSLSFGSVNVGTSAQSTANINLDGSATGALHVTSMTVSGDYQLVNNCSSPVNPGGACSLSVTFTPTAIGDRSGTVVIGYTLGTDSGQLVLSLDGEGLVAEATVAPSSLTFGSQLVQTTSAAQSVTVTNNGTATLTISSVTADGDFAMTNSCGTLAAGINCTIQVTFTPTAAGTRNGTVTISDELGTQVVALTGTGTAPGIELSQTNLNYGNQPVGTLSGGRTVNVTNTGNSTLTFTSITAAGDYAESDTCSSPISQDGTCTITVTFDPTQIGTRNGTVTLLSNAETQVIALTGTGTSNSTGSVSSPELTFSPQQVGTTSTSQQLTFTNTSGAPMTVNSCTISGDFLITSGCTGSTILQNGAALTMYIAFQPTAPGDRVGSVQINDTSGTQQVLLDGTGLQSGINLSPVNLNFGNQTTNTSSAPQLVTLTNTGSADLSITSLATTADFTATSSNCANLPATLSVGSSCIFQVFFIPTTAGTNSGTMTIEDGEGTQTVGLNGTGVLPGVQFSQSPLSFGSQTIGTGSAAQITTLTNNGLAPLIVSSVVATGDYSVTSSGCTITSQFTLGVGASCDLDVTFSPVAAGPRVGALTVTDNDGIQAIAMSGNGTLPGASLSAPNLSFGQVIVGASAQMTTNLNLSSSTTGSLQVTSITIKGSYTETDSCTGTGITVIPGGSCYISVTFSPTATGASTGTALIEYTVGNASGELVLQMTGTGTTPGITVSPSSLSFGSQVINTGSTAQTVQLSNTGTSGLTVSSITASGDFSETNNCASVPVSSNCSINVTFTPTAAQNLSGTITITHDVGTTYAGVAVVPLTGIGAAPGVSLSPASVTFATGQTINTTSGGSTVTLTNNGTSTLHVTSVTAQGDFSQSNTCTTVATNSTCTITVTFTPRAAGSRTGTVTIKDDAGTQVITLSGTGTAPGVSLSTASINFGSQTVNTTSAAQLVTITNNGGSTLTISSYQATGDFGVSSTNCTTVNAGGQCTLQITFTPTLTGNRTGSVSISDNVGAVSSVQLISLSGQGTAPGISLSPSTLNFGSVAVGSSSQLSVTVLLDVASDAPMTVNSVTVDGDFGVTNNCTSSVSPGGQCSMSVTFTPTTTGARTGLATITYTLGTGTNQLAVALSGTGLAPVVSLTPSSVSFGSQIVGSTSGSQVVTLKNTGNSGLTGPLGTGGPIITINGDFTQTNNCSGGLSVGGSCTITITFSPATTGTRNGIINISDNLGLQTVPLSGSGIAAGVNLSSATLTFGSQVVGTTSGSQSVTVTNSGTSSLSFTSIAASGDFAENNTCTSALSPIGTCSITVTFSPTATGTRNGTVTLVDNSGTQVITLSGTGNAPGVSLTATTLAFGSQVVGTTSASQSVTLTNNGTSNLTISSVTADSDFAETDNCITRSPLAAAGTCTITITFTPTVAGGQSGTVTIVDGAGTHVISLSGTGTAPGVSLSSSSLNFGSVVVNTPSTSQVVTLTNIGTSTLSISTITASGDFSETDTCLSNSPLPASGTSGNSCAITITFTPAAAGSRSGTIAITDGVGEHFVALTGTGNAPGVQLSSSTLTFGSQTVDTTSGAQTVTLTNVGTSPLTVSAFTTGSDFAVSSSDCSSLPRSVAAAGVCTLQVTFTPAATGTRTGTVTITDSLGTHVIALTGTGAAPGVSLSPATLTFGSVTVGSNSQSSVSVDFSSSSNGTLTVGTTSVTGDFTLVNHCSSSISPGGSCSISVTFTPTATNSRAGTALINYTVGSGSGQLVLAISGTGTAPGVSLSPSSLSFGSQLINTTSGSQSVTVTNNGSSALTFTSVTASGDFAQTNNCTSVASGNTCSIQVTFTPVVTGSRTGTVSIIDNAGTQTIALSGSGTGPGASLSPASYNFGSVVVNSTSGSTTITLTNTGTSALSITSITASAEFTATNTCGASVAANGGTCNITATFMPAATGTRNGTIAVVDGAGTHVTTLSGTGTQPGTTLTPNSLSFGNQVVNTTSSGQSVTLKNTGTSSLSITSITTSGDFADTSSCGASLTQNATCTITVTFAPSASGARTGAVTIVDGLGTQVVSLSGTGTSPGVSLSPSSLSFSATVVNSTSASQTVTLTNTGTSSLTVNSFTASGDFTVNSSNCASLPATLIVGGTCSLQITFTPTATGSRSGAITISDTAGVQPVSLTGTGNAPGAQLSTSTLTFGSQTVGTTSSSQTATFTNNGTSSMTVSSFTASGDFAVSSSNCATLPITLAAGGNCSLQITFTPTAVGTRTGAVTITDSVGTQAIAITGTGAAPGVSLSQPNPNLGSVVVGMTSQATVAVNVASTTNSGMQITGSSISGDFSLTSACTAPVSPGSSCNLTVTFAPTAAGGRTGIALVNYTVGSGTGTLVMSLSGTGLAAGVSVSPVALDFGNQAVSTSSASQTVTVNNTGSSSLTVNSVTASGDFSVSGSCSTIAAGGSCPVQVTFLPTAPAARTGTLTVRTTAGIATVALSGNGAATGAVVSQNLIAFGSQALGSTSLSQSLTLTNTGGSALSITSISASGDFAQTNNCTTLAPQVYCTVQVTFTPTVTGTRNGTLTIVDSATSHTVVLSGVGFDPTGGLSTSNLIFGSQTVGTTSAAQIATFTNQGPGTLPVNAISATGDFAYTSADCPSLPTTLAAGATCTFSVTFTPAAIGSRTGQLNMTNPNGTEFILLTGTGAAPGVSLSPANLTFGSVTVGTASPGTANVVVDSSTASTMTVTGITVSGDFSLAQNQCAAPVTASGQCGLTISFAPAASGARTGTAVISYSVGSDTGQLNLALSGTGVALGVSLSTSALNFGSVTVGTSAQSTTSVAVDSGTNGPMTVTAVSISGDFTISSNQCTAPVTPNNSCGLGVTFAPSAAGLRTGLAVINYTVGSGAGQLVLALSGTGTAPGVSLSPSSINFGSVTVGTTFQSAASVVVDNSTDGAVTVTGVTISGDFTVAQNLCAGSLTAGTGCGLSITFAPSAVGPLTGLAVINYTVGSANGQLILALSGNGTAPGVGLLPSSIDFGSVTVGTSSQQTANVTVDGTTDGPVTVTSVTVSGDFSLTTNQCASAIAPNSQCGLSLTFIPAAAGPRSGTAIVDYTVGTSTGQLLLALSGVGTIPGVSLSSPSLNFGTQIVNTTSAPQSVSLQNTGSSDLVISSITADGDFAQTGNCDSSATGVTLAPGNSCAFAVTFTPSATQTRSGTITVVDNAGTQVVSLTGTGNAPGVGLSSSTLSFAAQMMGSTSSPQTVILTNTGTSDLTISSITAAGDFSLTGTWPPSLSAGANCSMQVTFTPSATGTRNGTITIVDNEGTHVVALSGTGNAPIVDLSPSSLAFNGQTVGTTSAAQTITVGNIGNSPLTISSVTATGDFTQTNNCGTLTAGGNCAIQVSFTPTTAGVRNGAITLSGNALTQSVTVSGLGLQPSLQLSPASLTFEATTVTKSTAAQTVTVSNTGNSALTIASIVASAEFDSTNTCPSSLASGGTCRINVYFSPSAAGQRTGTLTISSNSANSPQIVPLMGTGADYTLAFNGSSPSAAVTAGTAATYNVIVTALNYSSAVSFACVGAPQAATCAVEPSPVQLNGTNSVPLTVTVATAGSSNAGSIPSPLAPLIPGALSLVSMAALLLLPKRRFTRRYVYASAMLVLAFLLAGCSGPGSFHPPRTPSGTYNLTLVATGSDGLQHTLEMTLQVN